MTTLIDLLRPYPVIEGLASALGLGDIIRLARINSTCRAELHRFPIEDSDEANILGSETLMRTLYIGQHRTSGWENLKSKTILRCAEATHKPNAHKVKSCRICSLPVCEACIIKAAFGQINENTYQNRYRSLCPNCWHSENPHQLQMYGKCGFPKSTVHLFTERRVCVCTAKDGHLCSGCKISQNESMATRLNVCFGEGCLATPDDPGAFEGRVCLWCDLPLPGGRSRAQSRRDYDARYFLARVHSTYDRSLGEVEPEVVNETNRETNPIFLDIAAKSCVGGDCPCGGGADSGSAERQEVTDIDAKHVL